MATCNLQHAIRSCWLGRLCDVSNTCAAGPGTTSLDLAALSRDKLQAYESSWLLPHPPASQAADVDKATRAQRGTAAALPRRQGSTDRSPGAQEAPACGKGWTGHR